MNNYYLFNTIEKPMLSEVGGKAMSLIMSTGYGLPVPEGFVISVNFFEPWFKTLRNIDLWKEYIRADRKSIKKTCDGLKNYAKSFEFNEDQIKDIDKAFNALDTINNQMYAVRSSSPEEDLEGA